MFDYRLSRGEYEIRFESLLSGPLAFGSQIGREMSEVLIS